MLNSAEAVTSRKNRLIGLEADLIIAGGGMAGCCAAVTAARAGIRVILVQDRPVLGGNASSEIRLWILGATSHMGNNNRWSREGGVIDEILVENLYRNREGNPLIMDTIVLEKVTAEPNITLLLNTAVYAVEKPSPRKIGLLKAFCSQNSTEYVLSAPLFCDASGDGIVGFLSGASFRMGAERREEFGEPLAPGNDYGELLGHSIYFYSKRVDHPVTFRAPSYALKDIKTIPRYKVLNPADNGCRLWWIEYGGRMDTVYDTEAIKWELWRVVYGVWDYIKNSGNFEDAGNLTLEWVGTIPGKRESRRFEGYHMLTQGDVIEQTRFPDAVAFGGWALDLHPADGIYSALPGCTQWHGKGIYQIPYRCFLSRDVDNLFYAGRIISTSHVAFSSSRVMATCSQGAQAVGMAAALCIRHGLLPRDLLKEPCMRDLQNELNKAGQSIPGVPIRRETQAPRGPAAITASSTCSLQEIPFDGPWIGLETGAGQLLPLEEGKTYRFGVRINAAVKGLFRAELRVSAKAFNYTPDLLLEALEMPVEQGEQFVTLQFSAAVPGTQYGFILFPANPDIAVKGSLERYTGIVSVFNGKNKAVSNNGYQEAPEGSGVESFEFWCPRRRPEGHNIAMEIAPALRSYDTAYLNNGFTRPYLRTNAWAAALQDPHPSLALQWAEPETVRTLTLYFDTDFDHPLESSLMGHPEEMIPFCVRRYRIRDEEGRLLYEQKENHQTINRIRFEAPVVTSLLHIEMEHPSENIPAALFEIHCE